MRFLNVSVKFLSSQPDFLIDQPKEYTLSALSDDVYLFSCSKLPGRSEKFNAEKELAHPREKAISNKRSQTYDDVADSKDSLESNYNPDSCEVVQEDEDIGSDSESVPQ
ncbi:hypothetical protein ACOSQ3_022616 [Xanthoceras sorbifolium]